MSDTRNHNFCNDCGYEFDGSLDDHLYNCEARTCVMCEDVFERVIVPGDDGERVCANCRRMDDSVTVNSGDEDGEDY